MNSLKKNYYKFRADINNLRTYLTFTSATYQISRLQFDKESEQYQDYIKQADNPNYDTQNVEKSIDLFEQCTWIPIDKYAENEFKTISDIKEEIETGIIRNPIYCEDGIYLLYPPEYQSYPLDELPSIGDQIFFIHSDEMNQQIQEDIKSEHNKKYNKQFNEFLEKENINPIENEERVILSQVKQLGNFNPVFEEASKNLYSSCFLLGWISFEDFINSMSLDLFMYKPHEVLLNKKYKNAKLELTKICDYSNCFEDMYKLKNQIFEYLLDFINGPNVGIARQIDFLNENFPKSEEAYLAPIIIDNKRTFTKKEDVDEFRYIRNFIVHDNSEATEEFLNSHPKVPRDGNRIVINERYLDIFYTKIQAIAYHIYMSLKEYPKEQ